MTFDAGRRRLTQSFFKNGLLRRGGNDRNDGYLHLEYIVTNDSSGVFYNLAQVFFWSYM